MACREIASNGPIFAAHNDYMRNSFIKSKKHVVSKKKITGQFLTNLINPNNIRSAKEKNSGYRFANIQNLLLWNAGRPDATIPRHQRSPELVSNAQTSCLTIQLPRRAYPKFFTKRSLSNTKKRLCPMVLKCFRWRGVWRG